VTSAFHPVPGSMVPEITVVVPTYRRPHALRRCLGALSEQTLERGRYEVIVCDDGSPAPVAAALAEELDSVRRSIQVEVVRQENSGPAAARNRAANQARGRFLAFTDDDCRPAPDWLERLLDRLRSRPDALLGGSMVTPNTTGAGACATQAIMDFVYGEQESRDGLRLFSTSNLAIAADAFHQIGGFATEFGCAGGEDYDLCARWQAAGGAAEYVPEAMIIHEHPVTPGGFVRQHYNYGRGLLRMRRQLSAVAKTQLRAGRRASAVPGSFYLRLVAAPLHAEGVRGLRTSALVALAQTATAAGAIHEVIRSFNVRRDRSSDRPRPARIG